MWPRRYGVVMVNNCGQCGLDYDPDKLACPRCVGEYPKCQTAREFTRERDRGVEMSQVMGEYLRERKR